MHMVRHPGLAAGLRRVVPCLMVGNIPTREAKADVRTAPETEPLAAQATKIGVRHRLRGSDCPCLAPTLGPLHPGTGTPVAAGPVPAPLRLRDPSVSGLIPPEHGGGHGIGAAADLGLVLL